MYFKMALGNVKKSYKDYSIYFLTLTLAVAIFYMFNSMEAQTAVIMMSNATGQMVETLVDLLGILSIFISIILGFLIIYANNFMIRRRKKEFGIYMTLGMKKSKMGRILLYETNIIGIGALLSGLILGVFLSQGMSVVTARLFEADMKSFQFIFSMGAVIKTIIYFAIIFLIVIVWSVISVSRNKLINLINADKKSEGKKQGNYLVYIMTFILGVICIGIGYIMVLKNGLYALDKNLIFEICIGSVGTVLFFGGLGGFFIKVAQCNKKGYFKNLNMFFLKGVNFKIRTVYFSMAIISLMLFVTVGVLSTGLGISKNINDAFKDRFPIDGTIHVDGDVHIEKEMNEFGADLTRYFKESTEMKVYEDLENDILDRYNSAMEKNEKQYAGEVKNYRIKLSDFNNLRNIMGRETLELEEDQIAIFTEIEGIRDFIKADMDNFKEATLSGKTLKIRQDIICDTIGISLAGTDLNFVLIVPDNLQFEGKVVKSMLSYNYVGKSMITEDRFIEDMEALMEKKEGMDEGAYPKLMAITKESVRSLAVGSKAIISFVGIYLGIIFVITSSAVLGIQQLADVEDNIKRFKVLDKIGIEKRMMKNLLFKQVGVYFLLPLGVALIHSIVGIKVANDLIREMGRIDTTKNIIAVVSGIIIVYGGYFYCTYSSCKGMIFREKM